MAIKQILNEIYDEIKSMFMYDLGLRPKKIEDFWFKLLTVDFCKNCVVGFARFYITCLFAIFVARRLVGPILPRDIGYCFSKFLLTL